MALFSSCNLRGARFDGVNLENARFRGCLLTNARFVDAKMEGGCFSDCNMGGIRASNLVFDGAAVRCNLRKANFNRAQLAGATFEKCDLTNANLMEADLHDAGLAGSVVSGVDLIEANLAGVHWPIRILTVGPFGSVNQMTTFIPRLNRVVSGCWEGTLQQFRPRFREMFDEEYPPSREKMEIFELINDMFQKFAQQELEDPRKMPVLKTKCKDAPKPRKVLLKGPPARGYYGSPRTVTPKSSRH